jgi:hypothetical protein
MTCLRGQIKTMGGTFLDASDHHLRAVKPCVANQRLLGRCVSRIRGD